jgi:hypothetical protein
LSSCCGRRDWGWLEQLEALNRYGTEEEEGKRKKRRRMRSWLVGDDEEGTGGAEGDGIKLSLRLRKI